EGWRRREHNGSEERTMMDGDLGEEDDDGHEVFQRLKELGYTDGSIYTNKNDGHNILSYSISDIKSKSAAFNMPPL
ncbi:hypothetical protein A2U01_0002734, partial [Trifolium medium]|nr:hypothetical protein [Trifolium medium]